MCFAFGSSFFIALNLQLLSTQL
uniref:Uncharacterized protein n=1 Tax=Anguilla anguilla TaxID=7936 RepID=A0A0E9VZ10_ANGAN